MPVGAALLCLTCVGCGDAAKSSADANTSPSDSSVDRGPSDITETTAADAAPFPENGWVVWVSNRDGQDEIYRMRSDGSEQTRLTTTGGYDPLWSPDARWIAYEDTSDHSARLMHGDGTGNKRLFGGKPLFWLWDNSGVICQQGNDYYKVDPASGDAKLFFRRSDFPHLADKAFGPTGITHDGRWLVAGTDRFRSIYEANNGVFKASYAAAILDLQHKDRLYFFGSGCAPRTPPSGDFVYHVCGDCPEHPDIYRMSLADLDDRSSYAPVVAHEDLDWGHSYFPRISNDNKWLTYGATTDGCHAHANCDYEIFVHRLDGAENNRYRLTHDAGNDRRADLHIGDLPSSSR